MRSSRIDLKPAMPKAGGWKPRLKKIDDVLVKGDLLVKQEDGSIATVRVVVGRPKLALGQKEYCCPIQAKGFFKGVLPAFGIGSVDSLMNAMAVLRHYVNYLDGLIDELPEVLPRPTLRRWPGHRHHRRRTRK